MRTLALLTALVLTAGSVQAATAYKWTDTDGRVHYGEQPPLGAHSTVVDVHTAPANHHDAPDRDDTYTNGAPAPASPEKPPSTDDAATADANATASTSECDAVRRNIEVLSQGGSSQRYRTSEGKIVRYSETEKTDRIADYRDFLTKRCHS